METATVLLTLLALAGMAYSDRPNIVFILTDDQDVQLGGQEPMKKTKQLIGEKGIIFSNMFVASPLCCPSRSSILTGKYVHNNGAVNNSVSGNCSSPSWQQNSEVHAFVTYIKQLGYNTFFAGKYLNQYGRDAAGGPKHIPPGWDHWNGLVGNSVYYNYDLSVNGTKERHGSKYPDDYLTDVIGKRALKFLDIQTNNKPFFAMLATPACHAPFTPAPQYSKNFSNERAPRDPSFNTYGKDKHWLLRQVITPMSNITVDLLDDRFRNRWRTLLSVDDIVENVITKLESKGMLENTYIFYAADNGFHLGQFSLPNDKRQLYEFDIRVPLMVRGPQIQEKQIKHEAVLNIDLAPTFIELTGGKPPKFMDGTSLKSVLHSSDRPDGWREDFLVEHQGEYAYTRDIPCPQYSYQLVSECEFYAQCVCEDAKNNTYVCVRWIDGKEHNLIYCRFKDDVNFVEAYNLNTDPYQLHNIASSLQPETAKYLQKRLQQLMNCSGSSCRGKQE